MAKIIFWGSFDKKMVVVIKAVPSNLLNYKVPTMTKGNVDGPGQVQLR
jgi:hypothetical protein